MKARVNQKYEPMVQKFGEYLKTTSTKTTINGYMTAVRELHDQTNRYPEQLTYADIKKYVEHLKSNDEYYSKRNKFASLKIYIRYLKLTGINESLMDDWGKEKKIMHKDIFKIPKTEKPRRKKKEVLTKEEIKKLFEHTRKYPRDHAIIKSLYFTTQRGGTLEHLNIQDIKKEPIVNPEDGKEYHIIHIKGAKLNEEYDIQVEPICIEAIFRYINEFREEPSEGYVLDNYGRKLYHKDAVFLNGNGQRYREQAMNQMVKRYAVECGINKRIYCHLFRASAVSIMYSEGVKPAEIIKRTGHSSISSLEPYIDLEDDESNAKCSYGLSLDSCDSTFKPKQNPSTKAIIKEQQRLIEELQNKLRNYETGYQ